MTLRAYLRQLKTTIDDMGVPAKGSYQMGYLDSLLLVRDDLEELLEEGE